MKKVLCLVLLMFSVCLLTGCGNNNEEAVEPINIYLFRGSGCHFCFDFLTYVHDTLLPEYGDKINVISYEVWYDQSNSELATKVKDFLKSNSTGVPFIIIGDKYFNGYVESWNEDIKKAIDDLYETKEEERYDVLEEMKKADETLDLTKYTTMELEDVFKQEQVGIKEIEIKTITATLINLGITTVAVIIILVVGHFNKKAILTEISSLKQKTKETE